MIIAIDGPAASGKGTIAAQVADFYGLPRLDSGALYRAVALAMLDAGLAPQDEAQATAAAHGLDYARIDMERIRSSEVGQAASIVAAMPGVRGALLAGQRAFADQPGGAVLEGRDIGTVVCPRADAKLFITAALPVRAERRWRELVARGETITQAEVEAQIAARDERDAARETAPLRQAPDAVLLDTTAMTIEEAAAAARRIIEAAISRPGAD